MVRNLAREKNKNANSEKKYIDRIGLLRYSCINRIGL